LLKDRGFKRSLQEIYMAGDLTSSTSGSTVVRMDGSHSTVRGSVASMAAQAQWAYTATYAEDKPILATAVVGVPGLAMVRRFGPFRTWAEANEYAERLNADLGVTPSESHTIVTDAKRKADTLIRECQSLLQMAKGFLRSYQHPALEYVLAQLELGVTFCHLACTRADIRKERLLRNAHTALSNAINAMCKFEFSMEGMDQIRAGIEHLQNALEQCTARTTALGQDG